MCIFVQQKESVDTSMRRFVRNLTFQGALSFRIQISYQINNLFMSVDYFVHARGPKECAR